MTRPIRVLFHVDALCVGGLERKVTQLILRLDRERFESIVSWSWLWGVYGEQLQVAGIPVVKIAPTDPECCNGREATKQIREIAPDIFHTFSCRRNAFDVVVAHRAKVPIIISARDNIRQWASQGPACNWEFDRNAKTDFVTPCCDAAADLCRTVEGIHPQRLVTIYNGVELPVAFEAPSIRQELGLSDDAFVIGYAARYRKLKGHEILLCAMRQVVDRRPEVHLVCCGEDEDGRCEQLADQASRMCLSRHVTLLGPIHDMERVYGGLDLYVHPSLAEALSMSILEAMSHGLPVVATAVGGTGEAVLHGTTGLLVPHSEPALLSETILSVMDRPEAGLAMGAAGRRRVEECFSIDRMVDAYQSLYLRAARPSNESAPQPVRRFTGTETSPELADTTVFVTTIGDKANFEDCMTHLGAQTVRCQMEVIDRVSPMSAAFAVMHERCTTPYYVQVDEDMLLYPNAIETLHDLMLKASADVALVCASLWDCDMERAIRGIKIYRHAIVKQFPYRNTLSCEVAQIARLLEADYKIVIESTEEDAICLGEHGKHYSPETAFRRWQRLFHKHNQMGHLNWLEPWPELLLERYTKTRDPVHLYAALGAIAGIASRADDREVDWRETNPGLQRMQFYFRHSESKPK